MKRPCSHHGPHMTVFIMDTLRGVTFERRSCWHCLEYLPLGPSSEDSAAVRVEEFMALDARNMAEAALDAMKREYAKLSAALWMAFHSGVCVGHATPEGGTVARYREQFELWRKEQP